MSRALRYCSGYVLCAAVWACGDSMGSDAATESNVRSASPSAPGSAGTGGSAPMPASPPAQTPAPAEAPEAAEMPAAAQTPAPAEVPAAAEVPAPAEAPAGAPLTDSFPGESCDGCVRFFMPITGENQRGDFERVLSAPVDMTGATLRFRLMVSSSGNAGGVSVYVRDAGNFDKGFVWTNLSGLTTWTEVAVDFSTMLTGNVSFDITRVAKVGVQINSAGTFAGATWGDAVVYLDSVRFSNEPSADLTFSDGSGDFSLVTAGAPEGTRVGYIAP